MASNADKTQTSNRPYSGVDRASDPTNEPGQYPVTGSNQDAIFGGPLPTGTGAPGTAGASGAADATNEPGQTMDGLTGLTESQITESGAPGSQGAMSGGGNSTDDDGHGSDTVTFTAAADGILPYRDVTIHTSTSGPQDSTQANIDGYATGGPQLPGIKGNEPEAGSSRYQPGGGNVMRGGRAVRG